MTKSIKKILVANRGEIALRIFQTLKEMGIATVAVYSKADVGAPFMTYADEAYCIGEAPASESYLCAEKILEVAKRCQADAIHPGYGFLSEKADFSAACEKAGLIFIGPQPQAIAVMGDKIQARQTAIKAGVPVVPGTQDPVKDVSEAKTLAKDMGYPVLLKAAAGGGGKGMRVVEDEAHFAEAFKLASSEAQKSFQDGRVYLEKYIKNPRHVEVQVLRDAHGQSFFLGERECSTQRRHQKVIEEAPCAYLQDRVREKMAEVSLKLTDEVAYLGVGTIEYLVDQEQNFYFLEMNTRLQVEHTVTEEVLGLDLVRLQVAVAQGEKLTLTKESLQTQGHAIQCRLYAEDPMQNFMPSPGEIVHYVEPKAPGVRCDSGVRAGSEISIYYDPMIAKLIVYASTRAVAIQKMQLALQEFQVLGVKHNLEFLSEIIKSDVFKNCEIHTQFLEKNKEQFLPKVKKEVPLVAKAAAALFFMAQTKVRTVPSATNTWWQKGVDTQLK